MESDDRHARLERMRAELVRRQHELAVAEALAVAAQKDREARKGALIGDVIVARYP